MAIGQQGILDANPDLTDGVQVDDGDLSLLSHTQGGQTPDLVLGGPALGLVATFEQQPGGGTVPDHAADGSGNIDVLTDTGHGRLGSLTLHVLGTDVGGAFEPGMSSFQPNGSAGTLLDANALNGLDGNNIQSLFVHGPARVDAVWTADDGPSTQSSADGGTIVHNDLLDGLGGGPFDGISLGLPILGQDDVTTLDNPLPGGDVQPVEIGGGGTGVLLFGGGEAGDSAPGGDLLSGLNLPVVSDLLGGGLSLDHLPALDLPVLSQVTGDSLALDTLPILSAILGGGGLDLGNLGADLPVVSQILGDGLSLDHLPALDLPILSQLTGGGLALDNLPIISALLGGGGLELGNLGADLPVVSQILGDGLSLDHLPGLDLLHVGDLLTG